MFVPENGQTIGEGASLEETSRACVARQRLHSLTREALHNLLKFSHHLLLQGKPTEEILEVIMPS